MSQGMKDDIIYVSLLVLGIVFGHFYRRTKEIEQKLWIGTGFGLAIILFCSGINSLHIFLSFLISCAIFNIYKA